MLSKNEQKFIKNLQKKKQRQIYNKFIAEGDKIVTEVIKNRPNTINKLYATKEWLVTKVPKGLNIDTQIVTNKELSSITALVTNDTALCILDQEPYIADNQNHTGGYEIVLDNIQDPGNLGTILRIADWFGIKKVICSEGCVDVFNPKVIQSTMGAFLRVSFLQNIPLENIFKNAEVPIYAGLLNGAPLEQTIHTDEGYIIVGNESKGIRSTLEPFVTHPVRISGGGNAESLNVAVATGIICHHLIINKK